MIMEVVVGTYEQVLVGFDVLTADDELEVTCTYLTLHNGGLMSETI